MKLTAKAQSLIETIAKSRKDQVEIKELAAAHGVSEMSVRATLRRPASMGYVLFTNGAAGLDQAGRLLAKSEGWGSGPALETAADNLPEVTGLPKNLDRRLDLANPARRKPKLDMLVAVACPTCRAGIGERCKSKNGKLRNRNAPHRARYAKALEAYCEKEARKPQAPRARAGKKVKEEPAPA